MTILLPRVHVCGGVCGVCLCGMRDCAWALNVKRMTHI